MKTTIRSAALAAGVSLAAVTCAHAAIIGAVGATIDIGGPGFGDIEDTFDQSGLSSTYISGVTDFMSFATTTLHSFVFEGNEWFSNPQSDVATVTYDLGAVTSVDAMALWNDEASGTGSLNLSVSSDGVTFTSLLSDLMPTDNPLSEDYGADIFSFTATSFQYLRMEMTSCPPEGANFDSCAIGEVAFSAANDLPKVPTPAGLPLLLTGLGVLCYLRRRKP